MDVDKTQGEKLLKKYWGYDTFRPLQKQAVEALTTGNDVLVLMPTGGGKSLCFQIPALLRKGTALVISPLISLMKDQVDSLNEMGIASARLDSSLTTKEYFEAVDNIRQGDIKLLYLSPEKLQSESFASLLCDINVSLIAVDEAHCVSMWGHDFRKEYRRLKEFRRQLPGVPMGAFTATATLQVREDIAVQLNLNEPLQLTGSFDRPNLTYRIRPRSGFEQQLTEVLLRHREQSGIIYCISRKETEKWADKLSRRGLLAKAYHAGLPDKVRKKVQDDFINDRIHVVAATVAFGMGIDKPDVRFVVHSGMPQSLEHYQQETGRAGRDGLPSECVLFYSGQDIILWRNIMDNPEAGSIQDIKLNAIYRYCTSPVCRHKSLLDYFHEPNNMSDCGACDICLGELPVEPDALIIGQKILSCVARLRPGFGGEYTAQVLMGSRQKRILDNGHDNLSTWGLLKDHNKKQVRDWIEQLFAGGYLQKTGEFNVLAMTTDGWKVLRGEVTPLLLKSQEKKVKTTRLEIESWEGVDEELYEVLRDLRKKLAEDNGIPAFMVFSDATLRDIARKKPANREEFLNVFGVGEKKWEHYGIDFLDSLN